MQRPPKSQHRPAQGLAVVGMLFRGGFMKERTPQEKKSLSLAKDRRNVYGEAPHGARKSIPLKKKLRNRANRHEQESKLPSEPIQFDADASG
jgi:hypothetical protein